MVQTPTKNLTLEEFLRLPETEPASPSPNRWRLTLSSSINSRAVQYSKPDCSR